jgi:pimeloyl-ACP methyl ester carboxylesterase
VPEPPVGSGELDDFWKIWRDKNSTVLQKRDAVNSLPALGESFLAYIEVLESDVWQYRATILARIQHESDKELLQRLEQFLFDEKEVAKWPAAGEHVCWALYNNANWATEEKWVKSVGVVASKKTPQKVKARILRELGVYRSVTGLEESPALARTKVKVLVKALELALYDKKYSSELKFLTFDALESLTSQDFGEDLDKWRFFANNLKEADPKPREGESFAHSFGDVELEYHSFAAPNPRPSDLEVLVLPDLGANDRYWYPHMHQINQTFKCTFMKLPDCSRVKYVEWMKSRDGSTSKTAYYYPLEDLVQALEERRKRFKQEKIGLIAHGFSGWIALEYLRLHPESVAFAVIIGTWSGQDSYDDARQECANSKDEAYRWYGEYLNYDPSGRTGAMTLNDEQHFWSETGEYKRRWADPKALEPIFYAQSEWQVPDEGVAKILMPRFEFDSKQKIDVPTLFIHGAHDPMFQKSDEKVYKQSFRNMNWAVFENSAGTPWAEEPERFFTEFENLLEKNKVIEKLKK